MHIYIDHFIASSRLDEKRENARKPCQEVEREGESEGARDTLKTRERRPLQAW